MRASVRQLFLAVLAVPLAPLVAADFHMVATTSADRTSLAAFHFVPSSLVTEENKEKMVEGGIVPNTLTIRIDNRPEFSTNTGQGIGEFDFSTGVADNNIFGVFGLNFKKQSDVLFDYAWTSLEADGSTGAISGTCQQTLPSVVRGQAGVTGQIIGFLFDAMFCTSPEDLDFSEPVIAIN